MIDFRKRPFVSGYFMSNTIMNGRAIYRVSADLESLENLKKSGNFPEKSEKSHKIPKSVKVREFCFVKFIFSQFEVLNFQSFLGEHVLTPL